MNDQNTFADLGVIEPLRRALAAENYVTPTPIQAQAIPRLLEGHDLLGIAQTGTGKTAAFAVPLLQQLATTRERVAPRRTRCLILAPTRELAIQIGASLRTYGRYLGLSHAVILGGVAHGPQAKALSRGVDLVVATPGRFLDHLGQGNIQLDGASHLVLDEADRMLDMGFIRDVRKILAALPRRRQTLLFSATMPSEVSGLAEEILHNPVRIEVSPKATPVDRIQQSVYFVATDKKLALLGRLLSDPSFVRVIVFTRTKHRANRVAEQLARISIAAEAIHGNKSQSARQRALEMLRSGRTRVLVATDIAARGIDIDSVSHVINYELPGEPDSYVHRIGRTARAGSDGVALSLCDPSEQIHLRDIEKLIRRSITVAAGEPASLAEARKSQKATHARSRPSQRHRFTRNRGRRAA